MTTPVANPALASPTKPDGTTSDQRFAIAITLLYLVMLSFTVAHHELWRDEWQAWMLARDSGSFAELLRNLRQEGHPFGWYLPLYLLARFTRNVAAMQALHVMLAAATTFLIARYAPLPRFQKVLLVAGYFFAYEYAVIARAYALGSLGLIMFCVLFPQRRRRPALLGLSLLILASSSLYGLMLAVAAGGAVLVETLPSRLRPDGWGVRSRAFATAAAVLALVLIALMLPAADRFISTRLSADMWFSKWSIGSTLASMTHAYLPFPRLSAAQIWGSHFLIIDSRSSLALAAGVAVIIGGAALLLVARKPAALFLYLAGTGALLAFNHFVYSGSLRHGGNYFLVFVASLWLSRLPAREWRLPGWLYARTGPRTPAATAFVLVLLGVHVGAAAVLHAADLRRPFSNSVGAVELLRSHGMDALPIAASTSPATSSVAGLLDRPIHYLDIGDAGTYVQWDRFRGHIGWPLLLERLHAVLDASDGAVALLTTTGIGDGDPDLDFEVIGRVPPGIVQSERYVIYRVRHAVR